MEDDVAELMPVPLNSLDMMTALEAIFKIRRAAMVWGPPGVGKSKLMLQLSQKLGIAIKDVRALLMNPVDVNGLPHVQYKSRAMEKFAALMDGSDVPSMAEMSQIFNSTSEFDLYGTTIWSRPGFLPADGSGILFFDELNSAPVQVQAALYQVMLDFAVGDHKLAQGWVPFAAGNRMSDRGHTVKMPTPLSDRMFHFDLMVEWEPWVIWAEANGIHPLVIAYLKFSLRDHGAGIVDVSKALKEKLADLIAQSVVSLGEVQTVMAQLTPDEGDDTAVGMLHRFNPKSGDRSFPTPRSWEMVSDAIKELEDAGLTGTRIEEATVAGKVGPTAAKELMAFSRTFRQGFTIDSVVRNPDTANLPDEPSMRCAIAAALARNVSDVNIDRIGAYINRMPEEYRVLFVKAATKRDTKLNATDWVVRFDVKHADIMA